MCLLKRPPPHRAGGGPPPPPRPTPLTLVAGAVAGDDLQSVATMAAQALSRPVAIAIPALGAPVIAPLDSLPPPDTAAILEHAGAVIAGINGSVPEAIAEAVSVQIGDEVVGIVVAAGALSPTAGTATSPLEQRTWLEAAAAAASVTALIRETHGASADDSAQALLTELAAAPPEDVANFLTRARRLGHELSSGAVAICAWRAVEVNRDQSPASADGSPVLPASSGASALVASRAGGRLLALASLASLADGEPGAEELAQQLRSNGFLVCLSAPRRDPALLHRAVVEAELLVELAAPEASSASQDETYRLLIGVLLRDRQELEQLRDHTITPLADYDVRHDTELLATLHAFLTHDGSTTETAEAMSLHRHTVGYRLSRVHEVSGLSPYESDGRERLSLGIKAHQILEAEARRL
jgi:PucR family transcriptional regulator, purine catabolism regulatory protein